MSMMGGGMMLIMIICVIIIGFAIYGIVVLLSKSFSKKEDLSMEILRERFAKGEIDEQEFNDKKARVGNKK